MTDQQAAAERFLALHVPGRPLLMCNAWDVGSARLLASLGVQALATTSSGFAASLGRLDYGITREEAIAHAGALAAAAEVPVSADLEDCFASEPGGVAETVRRARAAGLAGASIEDWSAGAGGGLLPRELAAERVAQAARASGEQGEDFVLTARAENYLRGNPDLEDTIARLVSYQDAGADVLYAPGLPGIEEVREVLASVQLPLNVLISPALSSLEDLAAAGVARLSVGGALAFHAYGAAARAARSLQHGEAGFLAESREGWRLVREALG
jgi:2-methylisocitrate lyase-like PEP mutase family enzyme